MVSVLRKKSTQLSFKLLASYISANANISVKFSTVIASYGIAAV
jgi:hypothetical protein